MPYTHKYFNKQQLKLLSSKFVYKKETELPAIKRINIGTLAKGRSLDIALAALVINFPQLPSSRTQKTRSEVKLQQIFISRTGEKTLNSLNQVVHHFLTHQRELEPITVIPSENKLVSWSIPNCRSSRPIHKISFLYPLEDDSFDVFCNVQHRTQSFEEIIFLLRLAQLPIITKNN